MDNYLIQQETVTIPLSTYDRLKHDAEITNVFKEGGVIAAGWWHGAFVYYSQKEFDAEIEKRIKGETEIAQSLKKHLDKLSKMSIFKFLKFKRTYSYTHYS